MTHVYLKCSSIVTQLPLGSVAKSVSNLGPWTEVCRQPLKGIRTLRGNGWREDEFSSFLLIFFYPLRCCVFGWLLFQFNTMFVKRPTGHQQGMGVGKGQTPLLWMWCFTTVTPFPDCYKVFNIFLTIIYSNGRKFLFGAIFIYQVYQHD